MHTFKYGVVNVLRSLRWLKKRISGLCADRIYFGRSLARVPSGAVVFFPCRPTLLACGLAGIVAFNQKKKGAQPEDLEEIARRVETVARQSLAACLAQPGDPANVYLGGDALIGLLAAVHGLKNRENFCAVYGDVEKQTAIKAISQRLTEIISEDSRLLAEKMGHLDARIVDILARRLEE
ncbi:MAG: hypothetical protein PVI72_18080, partial [Desulfobacterales bacterium]